ncbi:hypothetical protein GGR21_003502 [Dysgonomonas hofstadii]|uniref:Methyltransferase FkbM domain-containing protein n=1 Tax=Dysgonomonas hofstadii TaxID=637886 RepID=A0A840CYU0_9BACT|nr:FkbM family methyltransferase [Dysgonomonas hofstadii]MBB4037582.1 hypothetical protein [Dysgonomonas hofstadii]
MGEISLKDRTINRIARHFPLVIDWLKWKSGANQKWALRKEILNYYNSVNDIPEEITRALKFIRKKGIKAFPYPFSSKYNPDKIRVYTDNTSNMHYVMHCGHRLYYPGGMGKHLVRHTYTMVLCEQDRESTHCYLSENFDVSPDSILIDVGAAEGNFSLSVVEKAKKIYLFEMEPQWKKTLEKTFEPWKDKVTVINKYVSDTDSDDTIKLDTFLDQENIKDEKLFIKLDVEGAEAQVLEGAKHTLERDDVKIAICTYHNQNDHQELSAIMNGKAYTIKTSNGYMLFHYNGLEAPYFRRGLIRCQR